MVRGIKNQSVCLGLRFLVKSFQWTSPVTHVFESAFFIFVKTKGGTELFEV